MKQPVYNQLEKSEQKQKIRDSISKQMIDYILEHKREEVTCILTLPGEMWYYETYFLSKLHSVHPTAKVELICFERDRKIYNQVIANSEFTFNRVTDVLASYTSENLSVKYYHGDITPEYVSSFNLDLCWLDFCGYPTKKSLEIYRAALENSYLTYVTFDTRLRTVSVFPNIYPETLVLNKRKGMPSKEAILEELSVLCEAQCHTEVFNWQYIGGANSPMLTFGSMDDIKVTMFEEQDKISVQSPTRSKYTPKPKQEIIMTKLTNQIAIEITDKRQPINSKIPKQIWDYIYDCMTLDSWEITDNMLVDLGIYYAEPKVAAVKAIITKSFNYHLAEIFDAVDRFYARLGGQEVVA